MLTLLTLTKWEGLGKDTRVRDTTNGTLFLLNGNRIQGLEIRASTKSKFLYVDNQFDYREKPSYIEAAETVANVIADTDKTWQSTFILLNFYTDNDSTLATFARRINVEDIVFIEKDIAYPATKSWVTYMEGSKKKTLRCSYSLKQIESLADNGGLTTS